MLWEALAGRHPFWQSSLLETARAIEAGAPPLATLRPDLPKRAARRGRPRAGASTRRSVRRRARARRRAARARRRQKRPRSTRGPGARLADRGIAAGASAGRASSRPRLAGWTRVGRCRSSRRLAVPARVRSRAALTFVRAAARARAHARRAGPAAREHLARARARLRGARGRAARRPGGEPASGLLFALGPLLAPLAALGLLPLPPARTRSASGARSQVAAPSSPPALVAGIAARRCRSPARRAAAEPRPRRERTTRSTSRALSAALAARPGAPRRGARARARRRSRSRSPAPRGLWGRRPGAGLLGCARSCRSRRRRRCRCVLATWAICAGRSRDVALASTAGVTLRRS